MKTPMLASTLPVPRLRTLAVLVRPLSPCLTGCQPIPDFGANPESAYDLHPRQQTLPKRADFR